MSNYANPCIVVLTAPSGSGKTSIARALLKRIPGLHFSVSATTRKKRNSETDGVHYHFLTLEAFEKARDEGQLIEYEEVYDGCWYGTLRTEIEDSDPSRPVLLDIDVDGAEHIKSLFPDHSLALFIRPPSLHVLEKRLRGRGSDAEPVIIERLEKAKSELARANRFDVVVVNDDLNVAVDEVAHLTAIFVKNQEQ